MAASLETIFVHENWSGEDALQLGKLFVEQSKGRENLSFEYSEDWLKKTPDSIVLDPDLQLYKGRQYVPLVKKIFGLFSDSCPDRWGRLLLQRNENIQARKEQRKPRALSETDFLLGVYDEGRMGALRFSLKPEGPFLAGNRELATPPWVTLRGLESASLSFENDESGLQEKWLNQLLAPGSSLGGARPKATVRAVDGSLWIAKFPSRHDGTNAGAWEKTVHDLARICGLNVPESKLETFSGSGATFLVKRFDRDGGRRIHFSSAMTLLGKTDGSSGTDGTSYLELVSFIKASGASPEKDLVELWRRIVFSMAVSNTDDHLRNHGFILHSGGWELSPMFDVNPTPYGDTLSLNVSEEDGTIDRELAVETSKYYGISQNRAIEMAKEMLGIIRNNWKPIAERNGLSRSAIQQMEAAFSECYKPDLDI